MSGMPVTTKSTTHNQLPFALVALPVPVATCFTYRIPDELMGRVHAGTRVEVPFGRRILPGFVVELSASTDLKSVKPIRKILDTYLTPSLIELSKWMASYYGCSLGEAAQAALPASLKRPSRKGRVVGGIALVDPGGYPGAYRDKLRRAPRQLALIDKLAEAGGKSDIDTITKEWGFTTTLARSLVEKKIARWITETVVSPFEGLEAPVENLTSEQHSALAAVLESVESKTFSPMLLHGVTGSGKTEVYLRAARHVLAQGGGCIVLVPEIGLLPQAIARYKRLFGGELAVIHSRLTGGERFEIWDRVEKGACRLVLGPRSAIFSPMKNLRLIVVDEEQDDSYKQDDKPRYHARNVALMRGKFEKLTCLLGSATPSAESVHHALDGRYKYLTLPTRVGGAPLPDVTFVDLKENPIEGASCSSYLLERLEDNIDKGNQSILFLNKRGHARFIQCNVCGWLATCKNCDITLIYHRVSNRLRCHFCGFSRPAVNRCDECDSPKLFFAGAGTQRVELDLASLFPGVGILRMDADTTGGKDGHRRVLEQFSTGKYPILIGTQMVAKGHHFPDVNLVGVLYAEESLNYPDFRSSERTFQQIIQVAGRAGRAGKKAEVVVQTFTPEHYAFSFLKAHDYNGFMNEELEIRKQLKYPPFSRIVLASCSAPDKGTLHRVIERWTNEMRRRLARAPVEVLGPAPPLVERVKNRYREQVLIKGSLNTRLKDELLALYRTIAESERGGRSVEMRWDVDPESFY